MDISRNRTLANDKKPLVIKEPGSAITHFIGMVYALGYAPVLLTNVIRQKGDILSLISMIIFMMSMILLYAASTAYHALDINSRINKVLKKFDHMMIFVLIAGSYTPVCLVTLRGTVGYILLALVWGLAISGIVFKYFWVTCPKWVSSVIYIAMGWSCLSVMPVLTRVLSYKCFMWLLIGGIIYTVGGVIYCLKLKVINNHFTEFGSHEIFHLFVMGGSLCHFICMYNLLG